MKLSEREVKGPEVGARTLCLRITKKTGDPSSLGALISAPLGAHKNYLVFCWFCMRSYK